MVAIRIARLVFAFMISHNKGRDSNRAIGVRVFLGVLPFACVPENQRGLLLAGALAALLLQGPPP